MTDETQNWVSLFWGVVAILFFGGFIWLSVRYGIFGHAHVVLSDPRKRPVAFRIMIEMAVLIAITFALAAFGVL
ncbi:MAG: hypothetical protein AAF914_10825 [Pseudomonadota bacterium]